MTGVASPTAQAVAAEGGVRLGRVTVSATDDVPTDVREATAGEVLDAFVDYESALVRDDVETMTGWFWGSPDVVRFGIADSQRGADAVLAWRRASGGVPAGRWLDDTDVLVLGPDGAVVTTRFGYADAATGDDAPATGRQTQVWARLPQGWRVVSAHVSDPGVV